MVAIADAAAWHEGRLPDELQRWDCRLDLCLCRGARKRDRDGMGWGDGWVGGVGPEQTSDVGGTVRLGAVD